MKLPRIHELALQFCRAKFFSFYFEKQYGPKYLRHFFVMGIVLVLSVKTPYAEEASPTISKVTPYKHYVLRCLDTLIAKGTDRYGDVHSPIIVSILDVETHQCPENPEPLDEAYRVTRRERRNPAGSNLLTDQPLIKTMYLYSELTGEKRYKNAADAYMNYSMKHLVDEKGFFWWGWHRHYDVYKDVKDGHAGNHHEIHAIHHIAWDILWMVNPEAVQRELEAIWKWHVIDKKTGEINRHGDGVRGCDFTMSAGSMMYAFAFLATKTGEELWLERAKLLANYYWQRRNRASNLIPERPNAGTDRFDGGSFVTAITGCYCHSLLACYELTGEDLFKDQALAYMRAYANYGYDANTQRFWGALKLDGTPIPGPRMSDGYAKYEPRGHLDLWEPYAAGYQFAIYTAQNYAYAYQLTDDPAMLEAAKRFASWIEATPPGSKESENTWYDEYSKQFGRQGTYAGKYGRTISFFIHLYVLTDEGHYLTLAQRFADEAVQKLFTNGLFRGHPAKPYYEAMDGVGFLLYAMMELDLILNDQNFFVVNSNLSSNSREGIIHLDNW